MLGALGGIIYLVGFIWMIVTAIQTGKDTSEKVIWGLVCFLCSPLGSIIFFIVKRQGLIPLILMIVGIVLTVAGGGFNYSFGNMPTTP